MRALESLRIGEWVVRERIADKHTVAIRLLEAVNEIAARTSSAEYPTRTAIAMALAAGNVITVEASQIGYGYRYELNDAEPPAHIHRRPAIIGDVVVRQPAAPDPAAALLAAATAALLLLRAVQSKDVEETGEYDAMPYPEIVELENAISAVGGNPYEGEPGDVLPEICPVCHVRQGDQCQCPKAVRP